ncbi:hypothetical protein SBDP1_1170003 [Syntrophobacter sp. SbD1]|nr:hypothetical protein SBDP1_1170003 [Syntrophobacter sp. SbD1]
MVAVTSISKKLDLFVKTNIIAGCYLRQAALSANRIGRKADIIFMRQDFWMDTEHAYDKMKASNRIIQDFPIGKYALYTILFLVEIAICFAIVHCIQS